MSVAETTASADEVFDDTVPVARPRSTRPIGGLFLYWLRRLHLYFGLFLLPWAILYGVTAFLFNHPGAFSDVPVTGFGADALAGTALEDMPGPGELAEQVIAELNARQQPAVPYRLVDPAAATFAHDFAFATVKTEGQSLSVMVDLVHGGGTIRGSAAAAPAEKAPFATAPEPRRPAGGPQAVLQATAGTAQSIPERMKTAIPVVLERSGFPTGEVSVTFVPELRFPVEADGKTWTATCNLVTGSVAGRLADSSSDSLSFRRFLLRLHTAHGYPGSIGAKWLWAAVVDGMAFVMVFWGLSGLLMWWQIKSTRLLGFVLLLLSAAAATALALGMHQVLAN